MGKETLTKENEQRIKMMNPKSLLFGVRKNLFQYKTV